MQCIQQWNKHSLSVHVLVLKLACDIICMQRVNHTDPIRTKELLRWERIPFVVSSAAASAAIAAALHSLYKQTKHFNTHTNNKHKKKHIL